MPVDGGSNTGKDLKKGGKGMGTVWADNPPVLVLGNGKVSSPRAPTPQLLKFHQASALSPAL